MTTRKKLIEVALPLEAINQEASNRKLKAPKGWPTSFHKWWAQRPLAAARAVLFAQMVDDPSSNPDLFRTEKKQEHERRRLLGIIEELAKWDNTHDERVLNAAREEIWQSWRRTCAENADHPEAADIFDRNRLPPFCDPFAGSGSIPLSAQWLGLNSYASDLNPVAVLINKAATEIPSRFGGAPPTNPDAHRGDTLLGAKWRGAQGLADDVRYYGRWMRDEAERRVGEFYPGVVITSHVANGRPDLRPHIGKPLTVIAWLWARTVKSPNPAFANVDVPLASTFMLSTKAGREAYVEPVIQDGSYTFTVRVGRPRDPERTRRGTKSGSSGSTFLCLMSGTPMTFEYLRAEAKAGRMGIKLMAVVVQGDDGRVYVPPTREMEAVALTANGQNPPDADLPEKALGFRVQEYGMTKWRDLFTSRQLLTLTTFSELVSDALPLIRRDAVKAGMADDSRAFRDGGCGAAAYAEAVAVYLACAVDRMAYYGSSLGSWLPKDNALRDCMPRQALAMVWDFAEANPFGKSSGDALTCVNVVSNYLDVATPNAPAWASQSDAKTFAFTPSKFVISTDPPYYDNIGYADLSDFFYVWLRRSLRQVFPDLFATLAVPKTEELVATPYRHGSREMAEVFFLSGMTKAMNRVAEHAHPSYPVTIYYAFKQSESDDDEGTTNTGWDTFLAAVIESGFALSGTWPLRTERAGRLVASGTNALASSIILVCRPRAVDAPTATRREFVGALKAELPSALAHLQRSNIAPVDLAQAAIGPGMAVYTRYASVLDAGGTPVPVREALALINETLDEALTQQEGDFDADSRWALAWFEQHGFDEGEFGVADVLARAKNTSVQGLVAAGILKSSRGDVRLLKPSELAADWNPATDPRLSAWESVHQLIRVLESGGEAAAAELVAKLGSKAELARELCYRLYTLCERKKRATEALSYNGLVQSFPELERLAKEPGRRAPAQASMLVEDEE
jgi:putative DNA methylase